MTSTSTTKDQSGTAGRQGISSQLRGIFDAAGAEGYLHCRDLSSGAEVALEADRPVVTASVFKLPVLVEYCCQAATGQVQETERVRVPAEGRTIGPSGLSVLLDDVELSWRDLVTSMMTVSDNCATDVILNRLGLDAVNQRLASLGLVQTTLIGDCRRLLDEFVEDVGGQEAANSIGPDTEPSMLAIARTLDPARTNRTTAREMTSLLARIWQDSAGAPEACAEARRILRLQLFRDRLRAGFPDEVQVAGKTGTLPGIRNEVGVVEYPDQACYSVAVFTRARSPGQVQPAIDASIGRAARAAVDWLRADA